MNTRFPSCLVFALAIVVLGFAPGIPAAHAAPANDGPKADARKSPFALKVDSTPLDRSSPQPASYAPIVDKYAASVVHVYSTRRVRGQDLSPFFDDPVFRRFFGNPHGGGVPQAPEQTQRGLGSGVIISSDGYVLTNNHVVEGADDVKVSLGDSSRRYDAKVVGTDALADVAVLQIEADNLVPAVLGDSGNLKVGDTVLAIGSPFGVGTSVSSGIVSALGRGNLGIEALEDFIQTDAAINPGNSGGALIDAKGRLIGINTAILSRSGGFAGVGFAIPINLARSVAEQIVNTGEVSRGFLGVVPQDLTPELASSFGTDRGALLAEVTADSPADKAGLKAGDIVTKVNDRAITDSRSLLLAVSQLAPETKVTVEYRRDNKVEQTSVTLGRRPDEARQAGGRRGSDQGADEGVLSGVAVADLDAATRRQLQIPERIEGALVANVDPSSPAGQQGLQAGDVILELDRRPVRNAEEAVQLSKEIEGPKVMLRLWREGHAVFAVIDESRK